LAEGKEREERTIELLNMVGLSEEFLNKYPHELSGGQRQRVTIARALASNPEFLVLDEPTSSLDVSVGAQILNLLKRLQQELGLTYMFISHNFYVVRFMSNRIAVMYLGKIVELADAKELILNPLHPYTKALLSAIPVLDPEYKDKKERIILPGDPPSPVNPPSGCRFHPRCVYAMDICKKEEPPLIEVKKDHLVACHLLTT
ncbi:peptide ABC transporter substrate-binding protein, partial [Archaeoglobales archaeon]